jgi:hypothetical protein
MTLPLQPRFRAIRTIMSKDKVRAKRRETRIVTVLISGTSIPKGMNPVLEFEPLKVGIVNMVHFVIGENLEKQVPPPCSAVFAVTEAEESVMTN